MLQAGLDLLNKLPQEKHLRPWVCRPSLPGPGDVSDGKMIFFGLLASRGRVLSGALHSAELQRQADTREVSCSSQTGETRGRAGPRRGRGCWAGWQPRTGPEMGRIMSETQGQSGAVRPAISGLTAKLELDR